MEKLSAAIGVLDEKINELEIMIGEEREKGRVAHQRNASKHLVAGHLRAVKAMEAQHVNVINMKTNLVERLIAEESAAIVKTYSEAMGSCLKKKGLNIDALQKTIDTVQDRMEDATEVSELISEPLSSSTDIDNEIEAMFGSAGNVPPEPDADGGAHPPVAAAMSFPDVPKQQIPVSPEEKALEKALGEFRL